MNSLARVGIAMWRTVKDNLDDLLILAIGSSVKLGAKTVIEKIIPELPTPQGAARLAGVRALTAKTIDGAVIEGASAQAWAKFTIKNGLPKSEDERRLIIENEPHQVDGFNGKIPEGYGKGRKTLIYHGPVVLKLGSKKSVQTADYHFHQADKAGPHYDLAVTGVPSQQFSLRPRRFELHFCQGPLAGKRFAVVNTIMKEGEGGRMLVPMRDRGQVLAKPDYRLKDEAWLKTLDRRDWLVERKYDGSLVNCVIDNNRVHMRSHRDGGVTYYDRLPGLEDLSNHSRLWSCRYLFPGPKLNGTVFKAEAVHIDGAAKLAGILNSNPAKAIEYQRRHGNVKGWAWSVVKYRGRDVTKWTNAERRELLEETISEIRRFNKNWCIAEKAPAHFTPEQFYQAVTLDRLPFGEGVVLKPIDGTAEEWFKVKARPTMDLPIAGFVEGTGKFAGSLGAIEIINPDTGEVGEIGSLAVSDDERRWMWIHRDDLVGETAVVKAMELTDRGVPRAGVFLGLHPEKGSTHLLEAAPEQLLTKG